MIGEDCDETLTSSSFCAQDYISITFLANKRDHATQITIQLYLNLLTVVCIMLFSHYIRFRMRKINFEVDKKLITPSDFALKATRVPIDIPDRDLRSWFESYSTMSAPIKVIKVVRTYDTLAINRLEKQKEEIINRYKKNKGHIQQVLLQLELTRLQGEVNKKLASKEFKYTSAVYITFAKSSMPKHLLQTLKSQQKTSCLRRLFSGSRRSYDMKGNKINLRKAPEPTDVLWKNLGYTNKEKRRSRVITNLSTLLILSGGFALIMLINWAERRFKTDVGESVIAAKELSMAGSVLIAIINAILSIVVRELTEVEKHGTKSGYATAYASKTAIALLVNTAFISLIANIALSESFTLTYDVLNTLYKLNIYGSDGLLQNIFYVFITNTFFLPIYNLFDPEYFLRLYIQRQFLKLGDTAVVTQKTANSLFEGPLPNMSNKYAQLIKTMLLTSFYAPGMPMATLFSLLGVALTYWSDKYIFLRRNALPPALNHHLNTAMLDYLDLFGFTFAVGNIMFTASLLQSDGSLSYKQDMNNKNVMYLTLGLSLLNILLPMKAINRKIWKPKREIDQENENYDEARKTFSTDYDLENPITRHQVYNDPTNQHSKGSKSGAKGSDKNVQARLGDSILSNVLTKMGFGLGKGGRDPKDKGKK